MDIIKNLIQNFSGGPETIALIILVLGTVWIIGHYVVIILKWSWKEVYPKLKENKTNVSQVDYNKLFEDHFKEKTIILVENQLKELKNYNQIFKDHYSDNVQNVFNELSRTRDSEIMSKVFGIYEKITELREQYAGRMATRADIDRISKEIRDIEKELSLLKKEKLV